MKRNSLSPPGRGELASQAPVLAAEDGLKTQARDLARLTCTAVVPRRPRLRGSNDDYETVKARQTLTRHEAPGSNAVEVAKGIERLTNGVSNFYLVEEGEELLVVDAGIPRDWNLLVRAVSSLGRTIESLKAVLITHAHADLLGFAERVRVNAHAIVWIHEADAGVAQGARPDWKPGKLRPYLVHAEAWRTIFGLMRGGVWRIAPIREVSSFVDGQVIDAPGHPRAVHVPGHTPGMAALFFEQKGVLMTGDSLVTRNTLTGRKGPQIMPDALNRDSAEALRSLDALEGLPSDLVLPGHGDPWTEGAAEAVRLARVAGRS